MVRQEGTDTEWRPVDGSAARLKAAICVTPLVSG